MSTLNNLFRIDSLSIMNVNEKACNMGKLKNTRTFKQPYKQIQRQKCSNKRKKYQKNDKHCQTKLYTETLQTDMQPEYNCIFLRIIPAVYSIQRLSMPLSKDYDSTLTISTTTIPNDTVGIEPT